MIRNYLDYVVTRKGFGSNSEEYPLGKYTYQDLGKTLAQWIPRERQIFGWRVSKTRKMHTKHLIRYHQTKFNARFPSKTCWKEDPVDYSSKIMFCLDDQIFEIGTYFFSVNYTRVNISSRHAYGIQTFSLI